MKINFLAVVISAFFSLFLGFLWFAKIFKNPWAKEMGYTHTEPPTAAVMVKSFSIFILGALFTSFVFGYIIKLTEFAAAFQILPSGLGPYIVTFVIWLGFFLPHSLGRVSWEFKSWRLVAIHGSYDLLRLLVMALIFWNWK